MTRINKLVCRGFKSFAKKTELIFGPDFNCVVGPNGSGKSNILDALTFVLGRRSSKAMRAEKSANLIYNGGKKKTPAKEAEVTIHFDNQNKVFPVDSTEVAISRIVKHDGASVYKLNNKKCNRNDILDLLSRARIDPDGYNIILQGDIIKFVEMATIERRQIIEEIAGIGAYEEKKQKSLRELERVENRLNEADIVLTERNAYLKELKKDRDQALEYKDLNDNIMKNKATFLKLQIDKKTSVVGGQEKQLGDYNERIQKIIQEINSLKEKIKKEKENVENINSEIERKGEKEQVALNKQIEQLKVDLATNKTKIDSFKNEITRIQQRREELEQNNKEVNGRIKSLENEKIAIEKDTAQKNKLLKQLEQDIDRFRKKNKFDQDVAAIEKEISELDKKSEEKQEEIQKIRQAQQDALREKDQLEFKLQSLEEQMEKVLLLEKDNKDALIKLKNLRAEFDRLTKKLNQLLDEDSGLTVKVSESRERLEKASAQLAKLEAKNLHIKESAAGDQAISSILQQKNKIKGIYGLVSDLGKVNNKYSLALEIAGGARIKSVVVETDAVAAQCIAYLKKNKLGTATFLPLNKLKAKVIPQAARDMAKKQGCHGLAIDLVEYDSKFKNVFNYVLADTIVVENIEISRKLGIGTARMVTLDGDLVELSGAMRGGYQQRKKGIGFQEKELSAGIEEFETEIFELQSKIKMFQKRKLELEDEISKLRTEKADAEGEIIKLEKTLHIQGGDLGDFKGKKQNLKEQIKLVDKNIEQFVEKISSQNKDLAELKIKRQDLRNKINQMQNPAVLAQLSAFEEKRTELRESIIKLESARGSFDTQIKTILGPDVKRAMTILEQNKKEEEDFKQEIQKLTEAIKKQSQDLKVKEKDAAQFYQKFKELFEQRDKCSKNVQKLEKQVDEKDITIKGIEQKSNTLNLEKTKYKAELAGLEKEFEQYVNIETFKSKTDLQELQKTISRLEAKKENIGNVNLRALEVYENVFSEYEKLLEKKDILGKEKEDVLKLIEEIESSKKNIYMKTFAVVNDIFKEFFSKLTGKGQAYLELENPDSPFDAGVEIKVKLSAKKFMDIKSLSGGEKTLTALAFIFAIQEHDPASFYIMDEVDAALDKHNSEKLAQLVRSYCNRAQYIVITHNDAVISEASNLYGISMNEDGISNVTSLEL
ncbi:chromosome segregation protein SMC [Candidatus Woesearchaeota archaeon]|nr:chromosome segregation protein SMC [Candidatus Woesearchaeota archaeon]